jgi:hypothetical protein
MKVFALLPLIGLAAAASGAHAGAWPQARGDSLVITKIETSRGDTAFDAEKTEVSSLKRTETSASIYIEHGLTERLTAQFKASVLNGRDGAFDYSGTGPAEAGLRYAVIHSGGRALSLYVGAVASGDGRNAGYAPPGAGQGDIEVRVLGGLPMNSGSKKGFVDVQVAHLQRRGLPDEDRLDLTYGLQTSERWTSMVQLYSGRTEGDARVEWANLETSIVRSFGTTKVQASWRTPLSGRNSPKDSAYSIGIWRSF